MARISPTLEGFRAAFRRPSFTFGEICWRWSVGATGVVLFFVGLFEYLNTLPVTNGELLFLRTRQPFLIAQALSHILRGSLARAALSAILAALLLGLMWMIAASVGRMVTARALIDYFQEDLAQRIAAGEIVSNSEVEAESSQGGAFHSLMQLSFLRVTLSVAAAVGFAGALILSGYFSPSSHPEPGLILLITVPLAVLICLVWWGLNWLLSLAAIFAVRDGDDAISSIRAAVALVRERTGAVFAVSTWTGLAHLALFVTATTVVALPFGFIGLVPWRLIFFAVILLTLIYFAVADWLYMARLAGYVCILEMPEALLAPPAPEPPPITPPLQTTIDRGEPILSDVPGLVPEV